MPALFALTLFVAAGLLFVVQPMVAKMVLPMLGGTPAVWTVCMLFFQSALLAGYAYAHAAASWLGPRRLAVVHACLFVVPLAILPFAIDPSLAPRALSGLHPAGWLLATLSARVGLPFFVVATTAPMLQSWFARTRHRHAHDPYFLYAASNLGSLLALWLYPLAIEPRLSLGQQSWFWTIGYVGLLVLTLLCAVAAWCSPRSSEPLDEPSRSVQRSATLRGGRGKAPRTPGAGASNPGARSALPRPPEEAIGPEGQPWNGPAVWVFLAFVPSSLMLGVTTFLSTDIAAVPLLWIIPLSLYLVSFVVVFARRPLVPDRWAQAVFPWLVLPLTGVLSAGFVHPFWIPLHLLTFFVACLVCHGALARRRPDAARLTGFYLALAFGGVLGGVLNGLVAPVVFDRIAEYPLALFLACLALADRRRGRDLLVPLVVFLLTAVLVGDLRGIAETAPGTLMAMLAAGLTVLATVKARERPARFAATIGAILLASGLGARPDGRVLHQERGFFGVLRVTLDPEARLHRLIHGNTLHGQQSLDPARRREPLSYFRRGGPIDDVVQHFRGRETRPAVAVVGLGAGTLSAYAEPGERWTFFEIDPAVERIARDPRYFSYLADCRADVLKVMLGDARVRLREAPDRGFGLIVLDAFSSDAVPVHLLTREALRLYRAKLAEHGLIAFQITNRYLDLEPVVALLARDAGLACRVRYDLDLEPSRKRAGEQPSIWAVMAGSETDLGPLTRSPAWSEPVAPRDGRVWTDQYSNPLGTLVLGRVSRRVDRTSRKRAH